LILLALLCICLSLHSQFLLLSVFRHQILLMLHLQLQLKLPILRLLHIVCFLLLLLLHLYQGMVFVFLAISHLRHIPIWTSYCTWILNIQMVLCCNHILICWCILLWIQHVITTSSSIPSFIWALAIPFRLIFLKITLQ